MLADDAHAVGFADRELRLRQGAGWSYAEGCAVVVGTYPVYPERHVVGVEVEIWQKGG